MLSNNEVINLIDLDINLLDSVCWIFNEKASYSTKKRNKNKKNTHKLKKILHKEYIPIASTLQYPIDGCGCTDVVLEL